MVGGFMEAVASDLEMDLSVYTDRQKHRYSYRELLQNVLDQPDKPDYILFMCKEQVTHDMLKMVGDAGIKAFTFNTAVPEDELLQTGQPREKMRHWIGHVSPDNRSAGLVLADELYRRYQQQTAVAPDMLVGLSGGRDSSASTHRNQGLDDMLQAHPSVDHQVLFANWNESEARSKIERLIYRYPTLDLVWSASDGMALGAITAAETKGRKPGQDIMIGGIDWEQRALEEIDTGRLTLSLGGHFMGGGLALLLIRDFHAGYDFADQGTVSMKYQLTIADRDNLNAVRQVMNPDNWSETDFRQFSKHYNKVRRPTPVLAPAIVDGFMGALSPGFR
jgi:ABC-type sugar transport system substrate-binding protein